MRILSIVGLTACFAVGLLLFARFLYPKVRIALAQPPFNIPAPRPPRLPYGIILDGNRKPVARATITFRDTQTGRNVASFTTDGNGIFRWKDMDGVRTGRYAPVGLLLTEYLSHSRIRWKGMVLPPNVGDDPIFWFSKPADYRFTFIDPKGKPVPSLPVRIEIPRYDRQGIYSGQTDSAGMVIASARPVAIPDKPVYVRLESSGYFISGRTRQWNGSDVHYQVKVTPASVLTGRVVLLDGSPARGFMISAFLRGPRQYIGTYGHGVTGPNGRFQVPGLEPGEYALQARRPYQGWKEGWIGKVTVPRPGTTVNVGERTLKTR